MSDWRTVVDCSMWRSREIESLSRADINKVFAIEALVDGQWEEFGRIDMDVAGEGWGRNIANLIVRTHNERL